MRKVSPHIRRLIGGYLKNRVLLVGEESLDITMRVPQGSVLGRLLQNIFFDHIMKLKLPDGVEIIGYADDTAVLVEAKNEKALICIATIAHAKIAGEIEEIRLKLAIDKTEVVKLEGRRKLTNLIIEIDNLEIRSSENIKYLGVIFSRNNSTRNHISKSTE